MHQPTDADEFGGVLVPDMLVGSSASTTSTSTRQDLIVGSGSAPGRGRATGANSGTGTLVPWKNRERRTAQVFGSVSRGGRRGSLGSVGDSSLAGCNSRRTIPPPSSLSLGVSGSGDFQSVIKAAAADIAREAAASGSRVSPGRNEAGPAGAAMMTASISSPLSSMSASSSGSSNWGIKARGRQQSDEADAFKPNNHASRQRVGAVTNAAGTTTAADPTKSEGVQSGGGSTKKLLACDKCGAMTPWRLTMPCGRKVCLCPLCTSAFLNLCDDKMRRDRNRESRGRASASGSESPVRGVQHSGSTCPTSRALNMSTRERLTSSRSHAGAMPFINQSQSPGGKITSPLLPPHSAPLSSIMSENWGRHRASPKVLMPAIGKAGGSLSPVASIRPF